MIKSIFRISILLVCALFSHDALTQDEIQSAKTDKPVPLLQFSAVETQTVKAPIETGRIITIEDAQKMASQNNFNYKNVQESVYQANAMIQSAWAMLMPNVSANASITRNQNEIAMGFPQFDPGTGAMAGMQEITIQKKWGQSVGFVANITLFNARSIPLIKNAYDIVEQTKLKSQIIKNDLLFAVTSSYYQNTSMKEYIRVAEENLSTALEFKKMSEVLLSVGQSTKIDVVRADIHVKSTQKELANAKDGLNMAKRTLMYLTGIKGSFSTVEPKTVVSQSENLEQLKDQSEKYRVEIKNAQLESEMAVRSKKETYSKWIPSFDATFNWVWSSVEGFSGENANWMLIFGAKWSIFEGGARFAEIKRRESKIKMSQNNLNQLTLDIRHEVEEIYLKVQNEKRNVELTKQMVSLAQQQYHLVSSQYKVEMVTSLDLLAASTELFNQKRALVLNQMQFEIAILALQKSIGEYNSLALSQ